MLIFKLILGVLFNMALFGVLLFLPAGTIRWERAWVFLGVAFVATMASTVSLYRANPAVLEARMTPPFQKGQPLADKVLVSLVLLTFLGLLVFIPLDVFRFHLMSKPASFVSALGLVLFVAGWWIITLSMRENAFAAPAVRHQEERQQRVIDTGVYAVIRHPMYAGCLPFLVGISLWLESTAAALLTSIPIAILAVRILIEERFLKRELKGYDAYMQRVRRRLIPFLW